MCVCVYTFKTEHRPSPAREQPSPLCLAPAALSSPASSPWPLCSEWATAPLSGAQAPGLLPPSSPPTRVILSSSHFSPPISPSLTFQRGQVLSLCLCHPVSKSCLTLCDPVDYSTPGLPVHHYLPEFAQTHVHEVGDALQPSHPLPPTSTLAFNLSQHQGLFQWLVGNFSNACAPTGPSRLWGQSLVSLCLLHQHPSAEEAWLIWYLSNE